MPTIMHSKRMRLAPGRPRFLEELNALGLAALGLQHMRRRVDGPAVLRVARDGFAREIFGAAKFAGLLQPESVLPEHEAVIRIRRVPGRQHARHRIADALGMAEVEIAVMGEAQRGADRSG